MELLLLDRPRYNRLYNCTVYDVNEIPLTSRRSPLGGTLLIVACIIFELFYVPCLWVLGRLAGHSCYKIMFAIAVTDVIALPFAGLIPGLFALNGYVFCSAPELIFIVGMFVNWVWCLETTIAILLAANRCIELITPPIGTLLFDGYRTWGWILLALAYSLFYGFFGTSPAIWSSVQFTWTYNPHEDYLPGMGPMYVNRLDVFHSIMITVTIPGCYALFATVLMATKRKKLPRSGANLMTKIIFLQVLILCSMNAGVSFCYALMGFVSVPPTVVVICGTWLWLLLHGHPPFVYLLANRTIRAEVSRMLMSSHHYLEDKLSCRNSDKTIVPTKVQWAGAGGKRLTMPSGDIRRAGANITILINGSKQCRY